jgi:hypothetical protein
MNISTIQVHEHYKTAENRKYTRKQDEYTARKRTRAIKPIARRYISCNVAKWPSVSPAMFLPDGARRKKIGENVKLSLRSVKYHAMKTCGVMEIQLHHF